MIRLRNITLAPGEGLDKLRENTEKQLRCSVSELRIVRRSVDARKKNDVRLVYTVDVAVKDEGGALARCKNAVLTVPFRYDVPLPARLPDSRPVIVGFGPAGMFAGLVLAMAGLRPIILERGENGQERAKKVAALRERGILDPESNIQFGEGGAGAFSDGKLTTGVKDPASPGCSIGWWRLALQLT